ncbi:hypothetical protein NFI96_014601, partial [Prochilodus magdalenae]
SFVNSVSGSLGETLGVTCRPQTVCALRESTVNLRCSYSNTIQPQQIFWFSPKQRAKWRNEGDPEDVALDSDYAGRVSYGGTISYKYRSVILSIRDLRERDSGHYHLMIISETGERYSSSTAVSLRVSDLQVRMTSNTELHTRCQLSCSTSCNLTSNLEYMWYINGRKKYTTHSLVLNLYSKDHPGSYSCSVNNQSEIRSPAVCEYESCSDLSVANPVRSEGDDDLTVTGVFDENCWSVSYSDRRVCALEGSSVDFPCTYLYPSDQTVIKAFWYYIRPAEAPTDLSVDEQFAGRVEFLGDKEGNCTLRMKDVRKSDSGQYRFRLITDNPETFSGEPGVILSVTDLQVTASPTTPSEGQTVTLTCISTCTLPNNPTYVWYKNGQRVTNKPTTYNKLYLESASPVDLLQYSCALGGNSPEENTVFMFITVGGSILLALILITGCMWRWSKIRRKRRIERDADGQIQQPGGDTYTALNPATISPDYDSLTYIRSSSSDTYSSLNPVTMTPDYDTLTSLESFFSDATSRHFLHIPLMETIVNGIGQTVCALRESTVNLECSYSNTTKPQQIFWFSPKQRAKWRNEGDPEDVALDSDYAGRVNYGETRSYEYRSAILTIGDLRWRDSGQYHLMVISETGERYSSSTAVSLTVSDLQMTTTDTKTETQQALNCSTTCRLTSNPTQYVWYKNGQPAYWTSAHMIIQGLYSIGPGSYFCSVSGQTGIRSNTVCEYERCSYLTVYEPVRSEGDDLLLLQIQQPGADTYTALNPATISPDYDSLTYIRSSSSDTYSSLNPVTMTPDYDTLTSLESFFSDATSRHFLHIPLMETIVNGIGQSSVDSVVHTVSVSGSLGETLRVTCRPQTVCALRESTVKLECSYSNTTKPQQIFWFSPKQRAKWRNEGDPEDVALDSDYAGRVSYTKTSTSSSTLTIRELRERDSGHYHLMIISVTGERYSSSTAVSLRVSGVLDENCWSVSYSDRRVCALEGSSVDFPCTYSYPSDQTVNKTFWYYIRSEAESTDLSVDEQFAGRVEFFGDKEKNCGLRMRNLTKGDSGQYHFRFITDNPDSFSGEPGVILSVTDLQVKVSPTPPSEGQTVTLTYISTCTLPNNPTYVWYKNGQPVPNNLTTYNKLYLESASPEDLLHYSCALGGPEDNTVFMFITVGGSILLALILIAGWMWRWSKIRRKRRTERDADVQIQQSGGDTYTALNPATISPDYDSLTTVCALRELTVNLECSYSNIIKPQQIFWFSPKQRAKWRNEGDPEDVALGSDYAGRVSYGETISYKYRSAILTIRDLRERDSGQYHLMIISETGERYSSSTAVSLTVSDLQLRMTSYSVKQVELTCNTSCSLTTKPGYYSWFKNGQQTSWTYEHRMVLSAGPGSYSCSVNTPDQIYSNTMCVLDETCWSVSYSDRRVCALEGSSVDFPCTYSYPSDQTVNKAFWYHIGSEVEPTDLRMDEQFAGRVEFLGDKERNCGLRMRNLTKGDSGQYRFRFITGTSDSFSGEPGVILSVTDLQVIVSPTPPSEGQTVTLTCISTCTLPNNPTYVWYKNGQPVPNNLTTYNKLYLESASPEDLLQYSCALEGNSSIACMVFRQLIPLAKSRGENGGLFGQMASGRRSCSH